MNMKKIAILALALCMIAAIAVTGTIAYFTDTMKATNVITLGDISAELYESKWHRGANGNSYLKMDDQPDYANDEQIKFDAANYDAYLKQATLMPFDLTQNQDMFEECTVAKNAYVLNTSKTEDCFVRVSYLVPKDLAEYLDIFYVNSQFIKADNAFATADARTLDNTDKEEPMIVTDAFSYSKANFKEQVGSKLDKSGEYCIAEFIYAERLTPGEMTLYSPISKITLRPEVTEKTIEALGYKDGGKFDIVVYADVIQADGFLNAVQAFNAFDGQLYHDFDEK